jgi:hypothetical protein
MEQKGMPRVRGSKPNSLDESRASDSPGKTKEKKGLGQKIKEKLHRH